MDAFAKVAAAVVTSDAAPRPRLAAIAKLGADRLIGASAVCARAIHDRDPDVRRAAARALARMGAGAVPGILAHVREHGEPALGLVADAVKATLGGDRASAPPEVHEKVCAVLAAGLRDRGPAHVRSAAAIALGEVGATPRDHEALRDASTFERDDVARAHMECAREAVRKRL